MLRAHWRLPTPGFVPGVFVCALLALSAAVQAADCRPTAELVSATVQKVVDGDTVLLADGRRVRLIGVNTPELSRNQRADQPGARRAQQLLQQRLPKGSAVWLQAGAAPRDSYGRTLAHLFLRRDGGSVEAALLSAGAAWQVAVPPNLALVDCLQRAERHARQQRLGLWRQAQPQSAAALKLSQSGYMRVSGRIERVEESRHSWWLELDGPLVVRLDKRDLGHFERLRPAALKGRKVTVRGWATTRTVEKNGRKPMVLPLRHPAMLE